MKRNISIVMVTMMFLLFVKTAFSAVCGNYGGDFCSNTTNQEVGDAVYRKLGFWPQLIVWLNYNHAGLYKGLDANKNHRVIEACLICFDIDGGVREVDLTTFTNPADEYYGSYNLSSMSKTQRNNIVSYGDQMIADWDVDYAEFAALDTDTFGVSWPINVSMIDDIRCDGVVEYSYERNNKLIWGQYSTNYNISASRAQLDAHNDAPDQYNGDTSDGITQDPYMELSPAAQRKTYGNTNTYMQTSTPRSPTCTYGIISGTPGINGWYTSDVQVKIDCRDDKKRDSSGNLVDDPNNDSGIYEIGYKIGSGGSYSYSKSSSVNQTLSSSGTLYFFARDYAGNYPNYAGGGPINIDKNIPTVSITSPCSSSCSSSSSTITVSGTATDSGGSDLDRVCVTNTTSGSSGCDSNPSGTSASFSVSGITLNSGSNTIEATSYDIAGNTSSKDTIYVTCANTYYKDADNDGYSDGATITQCTRPSGYKLASELTSTSGDCDDNNASINPTTKWYKDADNDSYSDGATLTQCTRPSGYKLASELTSTSGDCNDNNSSIKPGATEICDSIDNDCDSQIDENVKNTYYRDADGDGYGNPSLSTQACSAPSGYVSNSSDCNDSNAAIKPGATEVCDGVDNNCNGQTDENVKNTYYRDADGDGYGNPSLSTQACTLPSGYVTNNTDCDDNDANEHPNQTWYKDADNDGYSDGTTNTTSCIRPTGYKVASELTSTSGDCDDGDSLERPNQTWYKDADSDNYSDGTTATSCLRPSGYKVSTELTATSGDCNDSNASIKPGAAEICDGIDNNCNSQVDEGVKNTYYRDADGDGYGNSGITTQACTAPSGYVTNNTDCNDNNASIKPGATEICDGIDNNCNGQTDEGFPQNTYYRDADGDGYGNPSNTTTACVQPTGYVTNNTDCNDNNAAIKPGAAEICDGIDNNCNGQTDEGFPQNTYYKDADGDGYGNPSNTTTACVQPTGYVTNNTDCNDSDPSVNPGAAEGPAGDLTCSDGKDNDCDGNIDFADSNCGISLFSGWNLISLPLQPPDSNINNGLSGIAGKYKIIWLYVNGVWNVYDPAYPGLSDLSTIDPGKGYWIYMNSPATLTITGSIPSPSISLSNSWNLVGYNSTVSKPVTEALSSISGKYISVWQFKNGNWRVYNPANPGSSDLTVMEPGYGYWINMKEPATWTLP